MIPTRKSLYAEARRRARSLGWFRSEFVAHVCRVEGIGPVDFSARFVALPCTCGEPGCHGWACFKVGSPCIGEHLQAEEWRNN